MPASTLGQAIGRNARNLRLEAGITLDAVAQAARHLGLNWTTNRILELEQGRSTPSMATLFVFTHVLSALTGKPLPLGALLHGDDDITLTDTIALPLATVRGFFESQPVALPGTSSPDPLTTRTNLTDQWAAKKLGIGVPELTRIALGRWGATFSEERDRRAGPGATKQRKGKFTRELINELERQDE